MFCIYQKSNWWKQIERGLLIIHFINKIFLLQYVYYKIDKFILTIKTKRKEFIYIFINTLLKYFVLFIIMFVLILMYCYIKISI